MADTEALTLEDRNERASSLISNSRGVSDRMSEGGRLEGLLSHKV